MTRWTKLEGVGLGVSKHPLSLSRAWCCPGAVRTAIRAQGQALARPSLRILMGNRLKDGWPLVSP